MTYPALMKLKKFSCGADEVLISPLCLGPVSGITQQHKSIWNEAALRGQFGNSFQMAEWPQLFVFGCNWERTFWKRTCEGKCSASLWLIYALWISLTLTQSFSSMDNDKHMSYGSFELCEHTHTGISLNYESTAWSNVLKHHHKRTAKTSC